MDSLPTELKADILDLVALNSFSDLTSIASATRSFRALYQERRQSFLRRCLKSFIAPRFFYFARLCASLPSLEYHDDPERCVCCLPDGQREMRKRAFVERIKSTGWQEDVKSWNLSFKECAEVIRTHAQMMRITENCWLSPFSGTEENFRALKYGGKGALGASPLWRDDFTTNRYDRGRQLEKIYRMFISQNVLFAGPTPRDSRYFEGSLEHDPLLVDLDESWKLRDPSLPQNRPRDPYVIRYRALYHEDLLLVAWKSRVEPLKHPFEKDWLDCRASSDRTTYGWNGKIMTDIDVDGYEHKKFGCRQCWKYGIRWFFKNTDFRRFFRVKCPEAKETIWTRMELFNEVLEKKHYSYVWPEWMERNSQDGTE